MTSNTMFTTAPPANAFEASRYARPTSAKSSAFMSHTPMVCEVCRTTNANERKSALNAPRAFSFTSRILA